MTEDKSLTIPMPLTVQMWSLIQNVAPAMYASKFFGVTSPEQAMAIMLKGYELGLGLGAAFEFIHVIQGKPGLSPRGALALIQNHPQFAGMEIKDGVGPNGEPSACRVTMKRTNGFEYTAEFTMEDAARAGLVKPDSGWIKYPANMLRWRAVGFCADVVFPDVFGGMKRSDELGSDITAEGEVIDATCTVQQPEPPAKTPKQELAVREPGKEPQPPDKILQALRGRGGWIKTAAGLVRNVGDDAQPVKTETRQHVQATLAMGLAFEGATEQDIADNAKTLFGWLYGVQLTKDLTEQEGQAIKYAWLKADGVLNEYAKAEINACLARATEAK